MRLQRYGENPILTPNPNRHWESGAVFNCGATTGEGGTVYLLYRAIPAGYTPCPDGPGYANYISSIGLATSSDGVRFERQPEPILRPDTPYDRWGCEDPRITRLDVDGQPTWWVTYTALSAPAFSGRGNRVALASTHDFRVFRKHGILIPDAEDKDAVLFPEFVRGRIALLHRIKPSIQLALLPGVEAMLRPDPAFWQDHLAHIESHTILRPEHPWESRKIGAGPPPLRTEEGWLLVYHGVDEQGVYRAGLALLDLEDPARVIARLAAPILEPEEPYERQGDIPDVVFPTGTVVREGTLHVYYGAADSVCALATASLSDVLTALRGR